MKINLMFVCCVHIVGVVVPSRCAASQKAFDVPQSPFVRDADTLLLLHFDEGKGVPKDDSKYQNTVGLSGVAWTNRGKFGSGIQFDSVKKVFTLDVHKTMGIRGHVIAVQHADELELKHGGTVELWYYLPRDYNKSQGNLNLIANGDNRHGWDCTIYYATSRWTCGTNGIWSDAMSTTAGLSAGWHHLAYVIEDRNQRLYIDGVQAGIDSSLRLPDPSGTPLTIGKSPFGAGSFNGIVDEVRISRIPRYKRASIADDGEIASKWRHRTLWDNDTNDKLQWNMAKPIVVVNESPRQVHGTIKLLLDRLVLPKDANVTSLRIVDPDLQADEPNERGGNDVPITILDDNNNGTLDERDMLSVQVTLGPNASKVLIACVSTDSQIAMKQYGPQQVAAEEGQHLVSLYTEKGYLNYVKREIGLFDKVLPTLSRLGSETGPKKRLGRRMKSLLDVLLPEKWASIQELDVLAKLQGSLKKDLALDVANVFKKQQQSLMEAVAGMKSKQLAYQPVKNDLVQAQMFLNLGRISIVQGDFYQRLSYHWEGLKKLAVAKEKGSKVIALKQRNLVKGEPGQFMMAVTAHGYPKGAQTLKALGIEYFGNSVAWPGSFASADGSYHFGEQDQLFDYYDQNGFKIMNMVRFSSGVWPEWFMKKYWNERMVKDEPDGSSSDFFCNLLVADPEMGMEVPGWMQEAKRHIQKYVQRYKNRKSIVAWSVWGEPDDYNRIEFYHPAITKAFQAFLKEKYRGDISSLNKLWNRDKEDKFRYREFTAIIPPGLAYARDGSWRSLDWQLFRAKLFAGHVRWMTDIIREIDSSRPIMLVNYAGMEPNYSGADPYYLDRTDYLRTGTDLYPGGWSPEPWYPIAGRIDSRRSANDGDAVWIGEFAHWNGDVPNHGSAVYPEELREWVYTSFIHGAEFASFFVWDAGLGAWDLMYPDTTPHETSIEIGKFIHEANSYRPLWSARPKRTAALYYPRLSGLLGKSKGMTGLHMLLMDAGFGIDIIDSTQVMRRDLASYQVLLFPESPCVPMDVDRKVTEFVKNGGVVMASSELASLNEWGESTTGALTLHKIFSREDKTQKKTAVVTSTKNIGKGMAVIFESDLGLSYSKNKIRKSQLSGPILRALAKRSIDPPTVSLTEGVESALLTNGEARYLVLINHNKENVEGKVIIHDQSASITQSRLYDIFSLQEAGIDKKGQSWEISTTMSAHDVAVFVLW